MLKPTLLFKAQMHFAAISINMNRYPAAIQRAIDMMLIDIPTEIVHRRTMYPLPANAQIHPLPLRQLQADIPARILEIDRLSAQKIHMDIPAAGGSRQIGRHIFKVNIATRCMRLQLARDLSAFNLAAGSPDPDSTL